MLLVSTLLCVLDRITLEGLGAFPALALPGADPGVAAWIRRAAEADLVPRPGMGVERAQHRAGHDLPDVRRFQGVPHLAVQGSLGERVDDSLADVLGRVDEVRGAVLARSGVEPDGHPPPGLAVVGQL